MEPSDQLPSTLSEPPAAPAEARQRWRLTYRRRPDAPALAQREQTAAWEAGMAGSGLPIAGMDLPTPRPRLVFGAPLGVGVPAEAELVDVFLIERRPVADVRSLTARSMPEGHELIDVYDVWLGEPSLSGQVEAADYRVEVGPGPTADGSVAAPPGAAELERAGSALLRAAAIPRTRDKGGRPIPYDLRPLLATISVVVPGEPEPDAVITLRIRTRFDPERGVGRPEEVVGALAGALGRELEVRSIVREQVILGRDR
jgi:radical SAM-linked protein